MQCNAAMMFYRLRQRNVREDDLMALCHVLGMWQVLVRTNASKAFDVLKRLVYIPNTKFTSLEAANTSGEQVERMRVGGSDSPTID
jgi:hypothetical protein